MGIPHRHLDCCVSHQLLHRFEWHAAHDQVARERVAKVMPREPLCQSCSLTGERYHSLHFAMAESGAVALAKDVGSLEMSLPLKARLREFGQRNLAATATLGCSLLLLPESPTNDDLSASEIDVFPLQRQQLAKSNARLQSYREHWSPEWVGGLEHPLGLVEGQELKILERYA